MSWLEQIHQAIMQVPWNSTQTKHLIPYRTATTLHL